AGDRQRAQDERNVFLDLMLAAQDVVHLSCTGRSVRDNAPLPPSVLIDELLDVLVPAITQAPDDRKARRRARNHLVIEHPLQAFAEAAFERGGDARLRSFDLDYAEALRQRGARSRGGPASQTTVTLEVDEDEPVEPATRFIAADLPEPDAQWRDVPLERLLDFFRNPCRFLVRERLGIELRREEPDLEDDEPWELLAWPGTPLVERVLPALLAGASCAEARELAAALPDMPTGAYARRALDAQLATMSHFAQQVRLLEGNPASAPLLARVELEIEGRTWTVHGTLDALRPHGNVHSRYADRKAIDLIGAWLTHLLLCAAAPPGVPCVTSAVSRDRSWRLGPCAHPRTELASLVGLYAQGLRRPLPFFPKSSWKFAETGSLVAAIGEFQPSGNPQYVGRSESEEAGVRLAWRGRPDPLDPEASTEFERCAQAVFEPLMKCLQDGAASDGDDASA
ncbi:MAG TPA: exodeoxyribonuclease V subunit gamma, partial [Burkholderiaceae bacterium]|nr:exodeoxyribonuclease V subunit gamma [Burkholderiaceae bacterium]